MFGTHDLLLFIASGLLLNATPGPDTLYIVGRSSTQGWRAGATAALGIGTGTLVHILAAALGLSAILAASAAAFTAVKIAGAAYLVYVGISLLRSPTRRPEAAAITTPAASLRTVFVQGFLTNVLNPKVALFFLAFLPQFVSPDAASKPLAFLFLGAVFIFNGTLWCLVLVWSASAISGRLRGRASTGLALKRATGVVFIGLGVRLAVSK